MPSDKDLLIALGLMDCLLRLARETFYWEMWGRAERKQQILQLEQELDPR